MIEWPIAFFLLSLVVIQEILGSGKSLSQVAKVFWRYSQRAITPSKDWTALIFISLTMFCFASWESLLRLMLQSTVGWPLSIVGAGALLTTLGLRSARLRDQSKTAWSMNRVEWSLTLVGFSLLIQAWYSALILGAWAYWRASKILPASSQKI